MCLVSSISNYESNQIEDFFSTPKDELSGNLSQNGDSHNSPEKRKKKKFWPTKKQFLYLPKLLNHKERNMLIFFLAVALVSLITIPFAIFYSVTVPVSAHGGSYTEGIVGLPRHINPLLIQTNDTDRDIAQIVYSGLMKVDNDGSLKPDLAESYTVSEDNIEYTFKLREDALWHDGTRVTADDIVFTILTAQNPEFEYPQRIGWQGVEVKKIDEFTVSFKLKDPFAHFINLTTLGILPKHIWKDIPGAQFSATKFNIEPIGSGPYRVKKISRDKIGKIDKITLESFDTYYVGKPFISKINFVFFENEEKLLDAYRDGNVDGFNVTSPENLLDIKSDSSVTLNGLKFPRYFAVFLNPENNSVLEDSNVRKALNHATDKQFLVDEVLLGNGSIGDSPLLPGIIDIPPASASYPFDIQRANDLLTKSGWLLPTGSDIRQKESSDPDEDPQKLEIEITTSNLRGLFDVAAILKEQWKVIGVDLKIEVLPRSEIQQAIRSRNYESILFGEVLSLDPDPFSFWHSSQTSNPGLNLAMFENPKVDELLLAARRTIDKKERFAIYTQMQEIIIDESPIIMLYTPLYSYVQSNKIKNFTTNTISVPEERFNSINAWYIKTRRSRL